MLISDDDYLVRTLHSAAEITAFARLHVETFYDEISEQLIDQGIAHIDQSPDIQAGSLRAIVGGDGQILGQYVARMRQLCIGPARLPVYCIGGVAVRPDMRESGLGSVLMRDAVDFAMTRGTPLLLLDGIRNYYHRFGYTPVLLETQLFMEREAIRRLPAPDGITVRTAMIDDAELLLDLYRRHVHPVLGSFDRTLEEQRYFMLRPQLNKQTVFLIASDLTGLPTGYLLLAEKDGKSRQRETAAGDWPTIAALLKAHEARLPAPVVEDGGEHKEGQRGSEVRWQVPARSRLYYELADHIPCRTETHHHPNAAWMARLCDIDAYVRAMMPAWRERIARSAVDWRETLELTIGAVRKRLQMLGGDINLLDDDDRTTDAATIQLSPGAAVQLTFGFRPASHIATRTDVKVPSHLVDLLAFLYPQAPAGVARSDYF